MTATTITITTINARRPGRPAGGEGLAMRALFAMLTSVALTTPFIVDLGLADFLTFFNLLKLLGFKQVTISDGDGFSHQVLLK